MDSPALLSLRETKTQEIMWFNPCHTDRTGPLSSDHPIAPHAFGHEGGRDPRRQQGLISWKLLPPCRLNAPVSSSAQADGLGCVCTAVVPARAYTFSVKLGPWFACDPADIIPSNSHSHSPCPSDHCVAHPSFLYLLSTFFFLCFFFLY